MSQLALDPVLLEDTPSLDGTPSGNAVRGDQQAPDLRAIADERPCWLLDPIDGTINFANGLPLFATMVALAVDGGRSFHCGGGSRGGTC